MNRSEKLKILQEAIEGQPRLLRQLQQQKQREAMPYVDAMGVIDLHCCPPALWGMEVADGESIIEGSIKYGTLGDYIRRWQSGKLDKPYVHNMAIGILDACDSQYDLIPLHSIEITRRDSGRTYLPNLTIGALRGYYKQCVKSVEDKTFTLILFETDQNRLKKFPPQP